MALTDYEKYIRTEELLSLQDAGLNTAEALKAATTNAAAALGMADTLGSLDAGKWADVIAVAHDPRADLHEMGKVVFVMKGGKIVRDDLHEPRD